jgi:hypothetical protein
MKTKITYRFFLLSSAFVGFLLLSSAGYAQQKSGEKAKEKKTITIHVTQEENGKVTVIDTTVVTDGDFDADAYIRKEGVLIDTSEAGNKVEKHIIIRHPHSHEYSWSDSDSKMPDTIVINGDRVIVLNDRFDMDAPPPLYEGMPLEYNFRMPEDFPPMQGPQFEDMMEGMLKTFGLEDVIPFGEMKQVVVKKKNHGKKVIITFEDREGASSEKSHGNKKEEKGIIYRNSDQGMAPQNEEHIIIEGQPGEKTVITKNVEPNGTQKTITVKADVDKSAPDKQEKHVIIIQEEKSK